MNFKISGGLLVLFVCLIAGCSSGDKLEKDVTKLEQENAAMLTGSWGTYISTIDGKPASGGGMAGSNMGSNNVKVTAGTHKLVVVTSTDSMNSYTRNTSTFDFNCVAGHTYKFGGRSLFNTKLQVEDLNTGEETDIGTENCSPTIHPSDNHSVTSQEDSPNRGGGWAIPVLCAGLSLIACCLLVPQADANRRLVVERARLQADLDNIQKRVALNDSFLKKLSDDANLAERLAQRQMKLVREGTRVLELDQPAHHEEVSPFYLVDVPLPAPVVEDRSSGRLLSGFSRNPRFQLYATGLGLMMIAAALVLGDSSIKRAAV